MQATQRAQERFAEFGRSAELIAALYEFLAIPLPDQAEQIVREFSTWAHRKGIDPEASVLWLAEWLSDNHSHWVSTTIMYHYSHRTRDGQRLKINHRSLLELLAEMLLWDALKGKHARTYIRPLFTLEELRSIADSTVREGIGLELIVHELSRSPSENLEQLNLTDREKALITEMLQMRLL